MKRHFFIKNLQLGISSIIVIIVGLIYGLYPSKILPTVFGFEVNDLELKNILRAVMGLYVVMGIFLLVGIKNSKHWRMATLISVLFTSGLAFGRILSTIFDGFSILLSFALLIELALMVWGISNLKNKKYSEN